MMRKPSDFLSISVRRGLYGIAAWLLLQLSSPAAVAAPKQTQSERDVARALALEGADAFVAKAYPTALERFQRAGKLYDAPTITIMEARTLGELGRLLEAADKFGQVARIVLKPSAPQAFHRAVREARAEEVSARARLASVRIQADALPAVTVVYLDDESLAASADGALVLVNPGGHVIRAAAPEYLPFERTVNLAERQSCTVTIALEPNRVASIGPRSMVAKVPPPVESQHKSPSVLGVTGLVAGAAALATSAVFFTVAWREKRALEDACSPACPAARADDIDTFRLHRTVAYTSLAVGLVAGASGSYLLWGKSREKPHVAVSAGTDGMALMGAF
jgi:hypothetical protein